MVVVIVVPDNVLLAELAEAAMVLPLSEITTLPNWSSTDTVAEKLFPICTEAGGWVVNTNFVGAPAT